MRVLTENEFLRLSLREREQQLLYMVSALRERSERIKVLQRTARELGRGYLLELLRARTQNASAPDCGSEAAACAETGHT